MDDEALGFMREARAALLAERDAGQSSREQSITITQLETAILWRLENLRLRKPVVNEVKG